MDKIKGKSYIGGGGMRYNFFGQEAGIRHTD